MTTLDLISIPVPETSLQPATPPILASTGFLNTLREVEAEVGDLTVSDDNASQLAANLLVRLTGAGKALDDQRMKLKRPYMDFIARIDDAARTPKDRIEKAKQLISTKNAIYLRDKQILIARAERLRQAELAELEKKRAAEAAEKKAASEKLLDIGEEDEPPSAVEQKIAELKAAPAVVASKPSGIRVTVTLTFKVTDINKLADIFVEKTPKTAAIRAAYCAKYKDGDPIPEVPGLSFAVERATVSTGKVGF